eukprot:CAMPEP_0184027512 /NCGR_PEP_ID=MMETSP0954-20121128/14237_1 /TAXON_ID=627963 /ORGANISM="Aplanochytrium sp, Strain PBS07" /LENGTH=325 /DNA_ID=CAMNT_0026312075 /DNA_START=1 /DNA_END=978 /DNA_ORIENTATION=-
MTLNGPIVGSVLVNSNGKYEDIRLDMTPTKNSIAEILGGTSSIVGQYENGVVAMKLLDPKNHKQNRIVLPPPLDQEKVLGPLLLVKMDEDSEPQDFTVDEYEQMINKVLTSTPSESETDDSNSDIEDDETELPANFSSIIRQMMTLNGPIVGSVLVNTNGKYEDISLDMTPTKNSIAEVLGGTMTLNGPIVGSVLVNSNGKYEDIRLDMTPTKNSIAEILGGTSSIVGQYENGVVAMKLLDPKNHKQNRIVLPPPLDQEKVLGPLLLVKMDEDSEPQDFSVEEFMRMGPARKKKSSNATPKGKLKRKSREFQDKENTLQQKRVCL